MAALVPAEAAVSLGVTRLVVEEPVGAGSVDLRNEAGTPVLVQAWLDLGDTAAAPETLRLPFVVDPPVLRLEPGQERALRLYFTGQPAPPAGRESLFWLNLQEVPVQPLPAADGQGPAQVQVAFRTRIKVMYRPAAASPGAARAWAGLQASLGSTQSGARSLRLRNPSRVHVTLLSLATPAGPLQVPAEGLLPPGGEWQVVLRPDQARALAEGGLFSWQCIDDDGNVVGVARPVVLDSAGGHAEE